MRRGLIAEGFAVDAVHDGQAGYELARRGDYDAIILDLMLPGMSGLRTIDRLRAEGGKTPVLVLTARLGDYDQTDALDAGADDYLTTPFSFSRPRRPDPGVAATLERQRHCPHRV